MLGRYKSKSVNLTEKCNPVGDYENKNSDYYTLLDICKGKD